MIVVMQETVIVCTAVTMMGIMQSTMILVIQMYIYVVSLLLNECTSISFFEGLHRPPTCVYLAFQWELSISSNFIAAT